MNSQKTVLFVLIAGLLVFSEVAWYLTFLNSNINYPEPYPLEKRPAPPEEPETGEITIEGEIICLPHKPGEAIITFECAFGIKTSAGKYYGLTNLNTEDLISGKIAIGKKMRVFGTLIADPQSKYDIVDTIEVVLIEEIEGLEQGLTSYSDLSLDSIPKTAISVKYLVEHRSALNGKEVKVKGVIVRTQLEGVDCQEGEPCLLVYPQPRIFIADTVEESRDKNYDLPVILSFELSEEENRYAVGQTLEMKVTVIGTKESVNLVKYY